MFTLDVEMLDKFHVSIENTVIINEGTRRTKATMLLAYLLYNNSRSHSREELISILQLTDESDNPYNVLKNIIYRLRKMFEAAPIDNINIISFKRGYYSLSDRINYNIDVEKFDGLISKIRENNLQAQDILDMSMEAISLYKGDFLPRMSSEIWVVSASVRYQKDYIYALNSAYAVLWKRKEQEKLLDELNRAVYLYPYEEGLQAKRIKCLSKIGRHEQAVREYNNVCEMLQSELGVNPSDKLRSAYNSISEEAVMKVSSINEARKLISEKEDGGGAYYCNLEAFTSTFHYIVRNFERTGQSVYLILCTLCDKNGNELKRGEELLKSCDSFLKAANSSMRRGDIFTRYSPSQFLLMLPNISRDNCDIVTGRIQKAFYKASPKTKCILSCQVLPAIDVSSIIDMKSKRPAW